MNRIKSFLVVLFAALLAGVVFSACKKEDDTKAEGKKAGIEMCECAANIDFEVAEGTELFTCVFTVVGKYEKYFDFVYDPATFDGNIFSAFEFKDNDFKEGFLEEAQKCAYIFGL